MTKSSIVEFAIPSDAKHITADVSSVACACPDCLKARDVSMVWPLTSEFVTIVANRSYDDWRQSQFRWALAWTKDWGGFGVFDPQKWFHSLLEKRLVGRVIIWPGRDDLGNWPTAKYSAWRRLELTKWLKPTDTQARSLPVKS